MGASADGRPWPKEPGDPGTWASEGGFGGRAWLGEARLGVREVDGKQGSLGGARMVVHAREITCVRVFAWDHLAREKVSGTGEDARYRVLGTWLGRTPQGEPGVAGGNREATFGSSSGLLGRSPGDQLGRLLELGPAWEQSGARGILQGRPPREMAGWWKHLRGVVRYRGRRPWDFARGGKSPECLGRPLAGARELGTESGRLGREDLGSFTGLPFERRGAAGGVLDRVIPSPGPG